MFARRCEFVEAGRRLVVLGVTDGHDYIGTHAVRDPAICIRDTSFVVCTISGGALARRAVPMRADLYLFCLSAPFPLGLAPEAELLSACFGCYLSVQSPPNITVKTVVERVST